MDELDPRLNAFRPDLADSRLEGRVKARRFAEGRRMQVIEPLASIRKSPRFDVAQVTEALLGETVKVYERTEGWAWVQLETDGYVGYISENALSGNIVEATHRVSVPSTYAYPEPNLKSQPAVSLTLNAKVMVTLREGNFFRLSDGRFAFADHLAPVGAFDTDYAGIAGKFLHVPYYWGGKSAHGLDCSGLVQLSLQSCGKACPRDSDMQEESLGAPLRINDPDGLQRGDLIFWDGHVGIMADAKTLLHANGHHMMVVKEPLTEAAARIASVYGTISSIRRI